MNIVILKITIKLIETKNLTMKLKILRIKLIKTIKLRKKF